MRKRVLALLLSLTVILGGCGASDGEALVGTWVWELDLSEYVNSGLEDMQAEDPQRPQLPDYVTVEGLVTVLELEFKQDGTVTVTMDKAATGAAVQALAGALYQDMCRYTQARAAYAGEEIGDVDSYMAENGMSEEQLPEKLGLTALIDGFSQYSSTYSYKDGQLTLDGDPCLCRLSGDVLELEMDPGLLNLPEDAAGYIFPARLERK